MSMQVVHVHRKIRCFVMHIPYSTRREYGLGRTTSDALTVTMPDSTDGRVWHCHQDQVRRHSVDVLLDSSVDPDVSVSPTEVLLPL